jgi:hypothetical protein
MVTARALAAGLLLTMVGACRFPESYVGTRYRCDEGALCPPGFHCAGGWCESEDALPDGPAGGEDSNGEPTDGPECSEGTQSCNGAELRRCRSGRWETEIASCPLGCNSDVDPPRCYTFAPRNASPASFLPGSGQWIVDGPTTVNSDDVTIDPPTSEVTILLLSQVDSSGDARLILVVAMESLLVQPGATLTLAGSHPVAIIATDTITVEGSIDASATASAPGPGGYRGGGPNVDGEGPGGNVAPRGKHAGTYFDSGGSGGCHGSAGGTGGASGDAPSPGQCAPFGSETCTPLFGGSGGGAGAGTCGGAGGHGGGAVQLTAGRSIHIAGKVLAAGWGGGGGRTAVTGCGQGSSGGGGGAGGGILIEAPSVVIVDDSLAANGGGGGGGADGLPEQLGGAGAPGTSDGSQAAGGAPGMAGSPSSGAGGRGGAASGAAESGVAASDPTGGNGGGGGGSEGRIAIYTYGAAPGLGCCSPYPVFFAITPE